MLKVKTELLMGDYDNFIEDCIKKGTKYCDLFEVFEKMSEDDILTLKGMLDIYQKSKRWLVDMADEIDALHKEIFELRKELKKCH